MMSALAQVAPRIARAHAAEKAFRMRRISRCWQGGWHANAAGPCFDTPERAMAFRDREDDRLRLWCEARANRFACYDDDGRALTWREVWNRQGWPDHRDEEA